MAESELENVRKRHPVGLVSVLLYILVIPVALIVAIPIGITLRNFDGICILFAELVWNNTYIYPWSDESCDFLMYLAVASIFYSFFMAVFTLLAVLPRTTKRQDIVGKVQAQHAAFILESMNPVFTVINIVICVLSLISAIVISVGFGEFCDDLMEDFPDVNTCGEAQDYADWSSITVVGGTKGPRGHNFVACLTISSIGAWILFVIWFLQMSLNFRFCCKGFSCGIAEEKQRASKSSSIALRRSRMATPIGTPGHMTPRGYGPPPQMVAQAHMGSHQQVSLGPLPPKA